MENNIQKAEPQNHKSNDFMKLIIGIVIVIVSLIAIKYLASAFGIL